MKSYVKAKAHFAEMSCNTILTEQGWEVYFGGIIDYICQRENELMFVEVKSSGNVSQRHDQRELMLKLKNHGIKCLFYSPDIGFRDIN